MSALTIMVDGATEELAAMTTAQVARLYDRCKPDAERDSDVDWLVVTSVKLVLAERHRVEAAQMSDGDILTALEPIADLRRSSRPSDEPLRTALTEELTRRHEAARQAEEAWVDGPDEGEEFERGPAVAVCAVVREQLDR